MSIELFATGGNEQTQARSILAIFVRVGEMNCAVLNKIYEVI